MSHPEGSPRPYRWSVVAPTNFAMNLRVAQASPLRDAAAVASALLALTKPGVTRLVIATTLLGAALAPGRLELAPLSLTLLGTVLVVGSANALNMVLEHDVDGKMQRTKDRPLPSGRLSIEVALIFGLLLGVGGLSVLWALVNELTGLLAGISLVSYVLIYTPLKGMSWTALLVGAVPGAAPPVLGYTGLGGTLDFAGWSLFWVLFVWQVPHFLAISVFRRDEYAAAGLKIMPNAYGLPTTYAAISVSSILLVASTALPLLAGLGGVVYATAAGICGIAFSLWAIAGRAWLSRRAPDASVERWARILFFASMPYLVVLFVALAIEN